MRPYVILPLFLCLACAECSAGVFAIAVREMTCLNEANIAVDLDFGSDQASLVKSSQDDSNQLSGTDLEEAGLGASAFLHMHLVSFDVVPRGSVAIEPITLVICGVHCELLRPV